MQLKFNVGESKPKHLTCERCGIIEATVTDRNDCAFCGPTVLCDDCHEYHKQERGM